ncbi:MAG: PD40 domain-containing protein [Kangiellaceae bacterium]|nr:PD40 domain-containing protein [Kangiellaceae bacterium]
MKLTYPLVCTFIIVLLSNGCSENRTKYTHDSQPTLVGSYLDQKPPGLIPEVFAPGIISTRSWEYGVTFSPDLKEMYYLKEDNKKMWFATYQYKNNHWHGTTLSPREGQPFLSPNGNIMHLGRRYKERIGNGWSEVKMLQAPFDSIPIMRLTSSSKDTIFFDEFKEDMTGDIRYSTHESEGYSPPNILDRKITLGKSFHPFIAPDESYLIFDSEREGGFGDSDLYISFKQQDGSWGNPVNLGKDINTDAWEAAASVTPDGKYLFFHRMISPGDANTLPNVDIFWVDAKVIENLKKGLTASSDHHRYKDI